MFKVPVHHNENPEVGNHVGILSQIITVGTQQSSFNGEAKEAFKLLLGFEIPDQLYTKGQQAGQTMLVKNEWNVSTHPNAGLRKILEPWLGVFESEEHMKETLEQLHRMIGATALVNISHSEQGFANIASLTPPIAGMAVPVPTRIPVLFTLEPINWNPSEAELGQMTEIQYEIYQQCGPMKAVFDSLPEGTKKRIGKSPEFIELNGGPLIIPNQPQQRPQAQRAVPGQRPGIVRAGQVAPAQRTAAPAVAQHPVQHVAQPEQAYRQAQAAIAPQGYRKPVQAAPVRAAFAPQGIPGRTAFQGQQPMQPQGAPGQSGDANPFAGAPSDDDVPV